jgi:maleylpyruvate isomerase
MATRPAVPVDDLERVVEAESRLFASVRALDDSAMRSPSLLPGWTVGHLLTHLARNADSHVRRTRAAVERVVVDQYPGGMAERAAEIEAGAARRAASVLEDVAASSARMLGAWAAAPDRAWTGITRDATGRERPLAELPGRRWLEVEVHLVDLGTGPTHRDWSDAFVAAHLPQMRAGTAARMPGGAAPPPEGALDARDELAWLSGRLARPGLPVLGPWA